VNKESHRMNVNRRHRVAILGSTGSVGGNTLDVMARHPDRFEAFALSAFRRVDVLAEQCCAHRPRFAVVPTSEAAEALRHALSGSGVAPDILVGEGGLSEVAGHPDVDSVMAAIVGAAGLPPCLAAARAGKRLLLANKEALVVGGGLFMQAVRQGGATLLPIDSEHSAIFQCLPLERAAWPSFIDHIILTASGGPFRTREPSSLHDVTPDQACAHPNWVMGRKISVDSATMMNKALEVIEARWLFDLEPERIRVVIHPQSIIHSMVVCRDASVLAQLGTPDMRVPIAYGLSYPERVVSGADTLDFLRLSSLTFEAADAQRFPGLHLAYEVLQGPPGSSAVLNAANEVGVEAFLQRQLSFPAIHQLNRRTLDHLLGKLPPAGTLDELLAIDTEARAVARVLVRELQT
jgi:1-deoxy-D-xylulose-5-phosphate reductoisomerase